MDNESSVDLGELIMSLTDEEIDRLFEQFLISTVMQVTR